MLATNSLYQEKPLVKKKVQLFLLDNNKTQQGFQQQDNNVSLSDKAFQKQDNNLTAGRSLNSVQRFTIPAGWGNKLEEARLLVSDKKAYFPDKNGYIKSVHPKESVFISVPDAPENSVRDTPEITPDFTPKTDPNLSYLDLYVKSSTETIYQGKSEVVLPDYVCGQGYLKGKCKSGHIFLKKLYCGKEYCEVCGQDNSVAHKRRMASWEGKVLQMDNVGYLVITIPEYLRGYFRDKQALNDLRKYWSRKLKREGYNRGLCRWHWFGDSDPDKYHPHLNFLIEAGHIEIEVLNEWQEDYRIWLVHYVGCEVSQVVINYHYAGDQEYKKFFWLRYITRATFKKYNSELAEELFGYHYSTVWGKWKKDKHNIEAGQCPICNKPIKWDGHYYPASKVNLFLYRKLDNDYYIDKWSYDYDPACEKLRSKVKL